MFVHADVLFFPQGSSFTSSTGDDDVFGPVVLPETMYLNIESCNNAYASI